MIRRTLYPTWTWVLSVLVGPVALLALGIALVAATPVGDLPFDNAGWWWLAGVVPLAGLFFVYGVARRRRGLARFASEDLAPLLTARLSPTRQALRAGLTVSALLMIVVAILGPRWGTFLEKRKIRGMDIVVALDLSRSMLARDLKPNRLERAKREIQQQLIERAAFRRANRLGLLVFAGTTSLRVPLTTDHLAFTAQLESARYGAVPRGGTALSASISAATDLFVHSPQQASRIILLFTDGEDHEGDPVAAAEKAFKEHGIRVFTVGVGDTSQVAGAEVPAGAGAAGKPLLYDGQIVFSKLDPAGLTKIAEAGGGRYAPIQNLPTLVNAIASMWKTELTTEQRRRHIPRYQWFLASALMLLGIATIIADYRGSGDTLPQRTWREEPAP